MSLLKDIYSPAFYDKFAGVAAKVLPNFDTKQFKNAIFDKHWKSKELKDRMKHTAAVLHQFMPDHFPKAANYIEQLILALRQHNIKEGSIEFMFLPDYIETHGILHLRESVNVIETVTQFTSCEFAVRPFIINYKNTMLDQMYAWSNHSSHHVRRLASEGSRPRLPWAMAIPELKKNPEPILPLLDNLKNDPSEYVRRSVANNLNDIAKDHPDIVIKIAKQWKGVSKETDAIIKHGCRTLLKQGNPAILKHFGLSNNTKFDVSKFKIITPKVKIGKDLQFLFTVTNSSNRPQTIRIEYAVYFLRKNGELSKKVFKISERMVKAHEQINITRKQSFKIITTRKYYSGLHKLAIIINGQEKNTGSFELMA